ncbi:MAG: SDR family oxidoreductase, partial [Spirochaetota bacterium]|nr:SDR family oxidoreductase [Spirochaetota bacterium]
MNNIYTGKTVLVTGGAKGIGREISLLYGQAGCNLVISGRDLKALEQTAQKFRKNKIPVRIVKGDVTNIEDCKNLIEKTIETFGQLDILINNAGMSMRGLFENTNLQLFHKIIDINFSGAVNMTKFALPFLKDSRGSVVFISSISGLKGLPGIAPYSVAKMALKGFSESLRSELYKRIHIGIIYVSFTENDSNKMIYSQNGELIPLDRDKNSSTQNDVARSVINMTTKRKRQIVMTPGGKLANFFFTVFPSLTERLIISFS